MEGLLRKSEGRHSQLVEAVQSREGPVGVLYCARDVVMVQLPVEKREKRGDKKDGRRGGRGAVEQGQGLPALKRYTALAEDGLEVTGYPFAHTPSLSPFLSTSSSPPCTWP